MDSQQILSRLGRHAHAEGATSTRIEGLTLFRVSQPTEALPGVYSRSICAIAQGAKQAYLDGKHYTYNAKQYLCCSVPIPVQAKVSEASPDAPLLGVSLELDTSIMTETLLRVEASGALKYPDTGSALGINVARWDYDFSLALGRLLGLLDEPELIPVLAEGRLSELMVAILRGEAGASMRRTHTASREIYSAISQIRANPGQDVNVEELAQLCGMSRAVFHKKFKATTAYSPLQFVKALRLNEAAKLLAQGTRAGDVADQVGYTSASQFSREFRRHFKRTPREWAAAQVG